MPRKAEKKKKARLLFLCGDVGDLKTCPSENGVKKGGCLNTARGRGKLTGYGCLVKQEMGSEKEGTADAYIFAK